MGNRHTISRAGEIYAGAVVLPGNQGGRIGAPIGNAIVRFKFTGLNAGVVVATLGAASPVGVPIPVNQVVGYTDADYQDTTFGPVLNFASAGNESGKTATIRGSDGAGQLVTKAVALANIGSVETSIGWHKVTSIELSAALVGAVTVTTVAKFSFPYAVWGDGDEIQNVVLDGSPIASPSYTTARTVEDTITGADARGVLDLTTPGISDSTLVWHQYVNRTSQDNAIGLPAYSDLPIANYYR